MIINELILELLDATTEHFQAGEYIFSEDEIPKYYYQIINDKVKNGFYFF